MVDGSSEQPELEFDAVRLELELFSPELAEKPFIVAYNKMDLPEAYERWPSFKERLEAGGIQTFCMSAVKREGTYQVISGYRSPKTNAMLNSKSNGVAKRSLHMQGRAIDIRLPGVELKHLRQAALNLKAGGVGYYPRSNFIHVDTGRTRFW